MHYLIDFLEADAIEKSTIFEHLKCEIEEAKILQNITKQYINGSVEVVVSEVLIAIFGKKKYEHLSKLVLIKNLLDQGWITHGSFVNFKTTETANIELLNSSITLSSAFLKLLEDDLYLQ